MHPGVVVLFLSDRRVGCLNCLNVDVDQCEEMRPRAFGSCLPGTLREGGGNSGSGLLALLCWGWFGKCFPLVSILGHHF